VYLDANETRVERERGSWVLTWAEVVPALYMSSPFGSLVRILNDMEPVRGASHEGRTCKHTRISRQSPHYMYIGADGRTQTQGVCVFY
jgi:hypothetical protein